MKKSKFDLDKISISIPAPLNKWLEKQMRRSGMSKSAFITHSMMKIAEQDDSLTNA